MIHRVQYTVVPYKYSLHFVVLVYQIWSFDNKSIVIVVFGWQLFLKRPWCMLRHASSFAMHINTAHSYDRCSFSLVMWYSALPTCCKSINFSVDFTSNFSSKLWEFDRLPNVSGTVLCLGYLDYLFGNELPSVLLVGRVPAGKILLQPVWLINASSTPAHRRHTGPFGSTAHQQRCSQHRHIDSARYIEPSTARFRLV